MAESVAAVSLGEVLLQVLRAHNVEYIFSSPGSEWPPVWEALAKWQAQEEPTPTYINCRHEELAVGLAAGYAKATGRLPAVLLHTGVGTLHASMALRAAYHEQVPMVVAAGESTTYGESSELDPGSQWLRFLGDVGGPSRLAAPYVKWSGMVPTPETLPGMVQHACRIALTPPCGPTFLTIPMEVLLKEAEGQPLRAGGFTAVRSSPDPALLDQAAQLLLRSTSPLIITEHAGRDPQNVARLVALAESLAIPVVESQSPMYLNFPHDHPLHAGFSARPYLDEADVVLLLGATAPWHPPSRGPRQAATIILADEDPAKAHMPFWNYRLDLCLAGSLSATLEGLLARVKAAPAQTLEPAVQQRLARWRTEHERQRETWQQTALAVATAKPIDTRWVCHVIGQVLPQDTIVVEETITHRPAINQLLPRTEPGTYFSGHYGGLGAGLGLALGIKLARPERLVAMLIGDGAFNYNPVLAVFGFVQEYRLPLLIVVFDNRAYASMKGGLLRYYPQGWAVQTGIFHGTEIQPGPDYAAIARAFGGHGERVEDPAAVRPALERAVEQVAAGRLALVDVVLDPRDVRRS